MQATVLSNAKKDEIVLLFADQSTKTRKRSEIYHVYTQDSETETVTNAAATNCAKDIDFLTSSFSLKIIPSIMCVAHLEYAQNNDEVDKAFLHRYLRRALLETGHYLHTKSVMIP